MAGLLDEEELLPVFSNPNIARQGARARALAARRGVNTLPDPRTYAAVQGLLGTPPDEMGFSVLHPAYEDIRRVADPAFAVGTALGVAPLMGMARFSRPVQQASAASQRGAVRMPGAARAPQEEALRLAQQRAALPVSEGGLGLPPNNTPMDRARAMGFDVDAYHGSDFENIKKFDLTKNKRGEGVSVAISPENAQSYGKITYPLLLNQQKIFDPTNKNQLMEVKTYIDNYLKEQNPYDKDALSFYPFTAKKVFENLSNPQTGSYYLENDLITKALKDLGYSGSIGFEAGQKQLKIFDPSQIRSRFAAFDPFRRTAAIAAAMGVAAPDLLARTVDDEERRRQLLSGLLGP